MYVGLTSCFVIKDGFLFVGSTGGLYRSSNNGSTWTIHRNGLPQSGTRSMIVLGTQNNDWDINDINGVSIPSGIYFY